MNIKYDAVVLAGGKIEGKYAEVTGQTIKALIDFNGVTCLSRVITALRDSKYIHRIYVVGPAELAPELAKHPNLKFIPEGKSGEENIFIGATAIAPSAKFILCSSDIPFVRSQDIDAFIELCPEEVIVAYPIFDRKYLAQSFPEANLGFIRLKGGNIFMVHSDIFIQHKPLISSYFRARRSTIRLCRLLGIPFIIKFIFRRFSVAEFELKAGRELGGKVKMILNASPNLGFDIDLLSDYYTAIKIAERI